MVFTKTNNSNKLEAFRRELYSIFTASLDGMWESLYIAGSDAYLIQQEEEELGYCCIDETGSLLQIFLVDGCRQLMAEAIDTLMGEGLISSAKMSSIEPISFNACLSRAKSVKPNTYCYELSQVQVSGLGDLEMERVPMEGIDAARAFFKAQIGFDDTFGYTQNLLQRQELYWVKKEGKIRATGECRLSESQPGIADIGVIVSEEYRGQGLGCQVLEWLSQRAGKAKRRPICSTTVDNLASQKAIHRAGFHCSHIVFDMVFQPDE